MTNGDGSITRAVEGLRCNDDSSTQLLWERFFAKLCDFAETKIYKRNRRHLEADEIATNAFMALVEGVRARRFEKVRNRDELWKMLVLIAARQTINAQKRIDRAKRGAGKVQGSLAFGEQGIESVVDFVKRDLAPDVAVQLQDLSDQLLLRLSNDELRAIALLRMAGFSNAEIAQKLQLSERTIERKLAAIRSCWAEYLELA
jgi:RNA polymerase sigma factor (sigma-70 family)